MPHDLLTNQQVLDLVRKEAGKRARAEMFRMPPLADPSNLRARAKAADKARAAKAAKRAATSGTSPPVDAEPATTPPKCDPRVLESINAQFPTGAAFLSTMELDGVQMEEQEKIWKEGIM